MALRNRELHARNDDDVYQGHIVLEVGKPVIRDKVDALNCDLVQRLVSFSIFFQLQVSKNLKILINRATVHSAFNMQQRYQITINFSGPQQSGM